MPHEILIFLIPLRCLWMRKKSRAREPLFIPFLRPTCIFILFYWNQFVWIGKCFHQKCKAGATFLLYSSAATLITELNASNPYCAWNWRRKTTFTSPGGIIVTLGSLCAFLEILNRLLVRFFRGKTRRIPTRNKRYCYLFVTFCCNIESSASQKLFRKTNYWHSDIYSRNTLYV